VIWPTEAALWEGPVLHGVAHGKGVFTMHDNRKDNVKYHKGQPETANMDKEKKKTKVPKKAWSKDKKEKETPEHLLRKKKDVCMRFKEAMDECKVSLKTLFDKIDTSHDQKI